MNPIPPDVVLLLALAGLIAFLPLILFAILVNGRRLRFRFSLPALLIATTLLAALLGAAVFLLQ
jgi:hypothetical protein